MRPNPMRILLLEGVHPVARKALEKEGYEIEEHSKALPAAELKEKIKNFHAIGIRSKTKLTSELLDQADDLLAIGAFCIGTNQIENEKANSIGVPVFNSPYSNTRSVAELVICEIIALSRALGDMNMSVHQGRWVKTATGKHEVRGKILGIVGYGHIGSQVSVLSESLGMNVIFYDIAKKLPLGNSAPMNTLDDVLEVADFVSLHIPETPVTKGMMGADQLAKMKKGACLINASRGSVVDIDALAEALETGHLKGAAVDVFPSEPGNNSEPFQSKLQGKKNVILTPHVGGSTEEAQEAIGLEVSAALIKFLQYGNTEQSVNFPNVSVPKVKNVRRIINVHKNVPGVLGEINSIIAEVGANIQAQFLSTDQQIGYLVMDMEKGFADQVVPKISQLSTSIKTRVVN